MDTHKNAPMTPAGRLRVVQAVIAGEPMPPADPANGVMRRRLDVIPPVSLRFASGVQLQGFNVPAFVTRRAETQVRMKQNQTLIIAGLILDDNSSTIRKVPYLGDIPWAGALFRSTSWSHTKTELVMTVKPTIVQPIPGGSEFEMPTERGPMTWQETKTTPLTTPDITRPRLY